MTLLHPTLETYVAARHIYSRLSGDSTLMALVTGVFRDAADEGAAMPYIVYQNQPGEDKDIKAMLGGTQIYSHLVFLVRVIGAGRSTAGLEAAAARVNAVLDQSTSTTVQGSVWSCLRQGHGDRFGVDAGAEWSETYQRFELEVQAAAT